MAQLVIEVPDSAAALVAAAARERYADVVREAYPEGGETDAQAWRAVAAWWTANMLADAQADKIREAGQAKVKAAEEARDSAVKAAKDKAWEIVRAVMMVPDSPPTEDPTSGETAP